MEITMAKTNKKKPVMKKTIKRATKMIKKEHKGLYNVLYVVIFIILIASGSFLYFNQVNQNPTYGSSQNADGFYFYTLVDQNDYYYSANNKIGNQLKQELNQIINNQFVPVSYEIGRAHV
jgi:uncharacterized protein HemX